MANDPIFERDALRATTDTNEIRNVKCEDDGTLRTTGAGGGGGGAVTIADGADEALGEIADAAVDTDAPGTVSGKLRGIVKLIAERLPAALGGNGGLKVDIVGGSSSGVQYTDGDTDASITGTVAMWEDAADTLRPVSAAKPLPVDVGSSVTVDDGGGSLTVDGNVGVTGNVEVVNDVGNPLPVSDGGGSLTVDGNVGVTGNVEVVNDVGNPLPVNGTVIVEDGGGSITVDGTVGVSGAVEVTNDAGNPLPVSGTVIVTDGGSSITIDGTVDTELTTKDYDSGAGTETVAVVGLIAPASGGSVAIPGDITNGLDVDVTRVSGNVTIVDGGGSITVDGTVGVSGNVEVVNDVGNPLPVSDGGSTLSVDDGGSSLTVDGTVSANITPAASGGLSIYRALDSDETGITVKASAGQLYGYYVYNGASSVRYMKIYNKASSVPTSSDTPVITIPIPATAAANVEFSNGIAFDTGIGIRTTTGLADNDTGAPAANDVQVNLFYK